MSGRDTTLEFHDSGQDDVLFERGDMQTHTFKDFPHSAQDDDEDGDKSELLKEDKKQLSFWTFEYYQQFFDVETRQVFHRVMGSMLPLPHRNFLQTHVRPTPDLYGPFWICTTLVFTTAIAGNLSNYLASEGKDYQWKYDFHKVTFSATAIFCYWWLVPTAIYLTLWWRKSQAGYTFLEIICVYGYSLAIYIPISILWVVPYEWFKWTLVIMGALLSGGVLVLTFWAAVKNDTRRVALIVISLIFLCHLLLASGFVLYFFHVPPRTDIPNTTIAPSAKLPVDTLKDSHINEENSIDKTPESAALVGSGKRDDPVVKTTGVDKGVSPDGVQTVQDNRIGDKNLEGENTGNTNADKSTDNEGKSKTLEDQPKEDTKLENMADTEVNSKKTDTGLQPLHNEIHQNEAASRDGQGTTDRKRAAKIRERLMRKHSRNI